MFNSPLILALDYPNRNRVMELVDNIDPSWCRLKVGKELFTLLGPQIVRDLQKRGFEVFLDLKFHDIPNTVAHAVAITAEMGVWMTNVHASGGAKMMSAAHEALLSFGKEAPLLLAVTMLTSINEQDLYDLGFTCSLSEQIRRLARLTYNCGLDGIVCSAQNAVQVKWDIDHKLIVVSPGIRYDKNCNNDHQSIMRPYEALCAGADYIVIGRPITHSLNPVKTINEIYTSLISNQNNR
ncbi:MAG: orotidine-5'-phosphate decarboxylase [Candidatus Dasytiphilus stammeri]